MITVSERARRDTAREFGRPIERIDLVYNGIDTAVFRPHEDIRREPLRLMATASADAPLKGLRYLLEAYASLLPRYPQLQLLIVGRARAGGSTEARLRALGIAGEAMACGVPLVSTDGGALPEIVGDAGVIVPAADSAALARAIGGLLDDPPRRAALGRAGRQRIVDSFSWEVCARQMVDYYRRVLADADR